MLRYYLQVFGRVQGVGFRYTAAQLARAYAQLEIGRASCRERV